MSMNANYLHWNVEPGKGPLSQAEGSGTTPALGVGDKYLMVLDHRAVGEGVTTAYEFGFAVAPVFDVPDGVVVHLLAGPARVGGVMLAQGQGFAVLFENLSYDPGSTGVADTVAYSWSRRGVML